MMMDILGRRNRFEHLDASSLLRKAKPNVGAGGHLGQVLGDDHAPVIAAKDKIPVIAVGGAGRPAHFFVGVQAVL